MTARPPAPGRCRPFGMLDLMILIAATAGGLVLLPGTAGRELRDLWAGTNSFQFSDQASRYVRWSRLLYWQMGLRDAAAFWLAGTIGVGVCRLRRPRPPWRRLRCQPGFVACLAVTGAWVGDRLHHGAMVVAVPAFQHGFGDRGLSELSWVAPSCVIGAWVSLAVAGRWRAETGWIDRAGRSLGWGWAASLVIPMVIKIYW